MITSSTTTSIQPCTPQSGFVNEPFVDFKTLENTRAMQAALSHQTQIAMAMVGWQSRTVNRTADCLGLFLPSNLPRR